MIGSREARLVQYHAQQLIGLGWDANSALSAAQHIVYADSEPEVPGKDPSLRRKWHYYKSKLATHGDKQGGCQRIAIPKTSLSDQNVRDLGFHESGNTGAMTTLTHHEHNLRLHGHPDYWILYEDKHPNLTRALTTFRTVKDKADAIKDALAHVFGKGSPGLGVYLLGCVRDKKSEAEKLAEAKKEERRMKRKAAR